MTPAGAFPRGTRPQTAFARRRAQDIGACQAKEEPDRLQKRAFR
jgi:hypothetical protein